MRQKQARGEFDSFVAGSVDALLRTAYLVVWDLPLAEDLVQECLYRVARRWPKVRTMEHPAAYARRILVNLALDEAPRRARRQAELSASPALDGGAALGADGSALHDQSAERALRLVEYRSELVAALGSLAPRQRAVLTLRYLEDLPEAEVAEILGCSVGTVKSTASRALDRLRQELVVAEVPEGPTAADDGDGISFFVHHFSTSEVSPDEVSTNKGGIDP